MFPPGWRVASIRFAGNGSLQLRSARQLVHHLAPSGVCPEAAVAPARLAMQAAPDR